MPIINVNASYSVRVGALIVLVPSQQVQICSNTVTLTATIFGNISGHTFLWQQTGGTPVTWLTVPQTVPVVMFHQTDTSTKTFSFTVDGTHVYNTVVYGAPTDTQIGTGFQMTVGSPLESFNWQPNSQYNPFAITAQLPYNINYSPQVQLVTNFGIVQQTPTSLTMTWTGSNTLTGLVSNDLFINTSGMFVLHSTLPVTSNTINTRFTVSNLPLNSTTTYRIRSNYQLGATSSSATTNSFFPNVPSGPAVSDAGNIGVGFGYAQLTKYHFTNYQIVASPILPDTSQTGVGFGYMTATPHFTNYSQVIQSPGSDTSQSGAGFGYTRYYNYHVAGGAVNIGG